VTWFFRLSAKHLTNEKLRSPFPFLYGGTAVEGNCGGTVNFRGNLPQHAESIYINTTMFEKITSTPLRVVFTITEYYSFPTSTTLVPTLYTQKYNTIKVPENRRTPASSPVPVKLYHPGPSEEEGPSSYPATFTSYLFFRWRPFRFSPSS